MDAIAAGKIEKRINKSKFYEEFCRNRAGFPVLTREVYLNDLGVGESLVVDGFGDAHNLRHFMAEHMTYGFKDGLPQNKNGSLSERSFHHEIDELNLSYKITRQE